MWFGIELNYGLQAGHAEDRFYYSRNGVLKEKYLNSTGILDNSKFIGMKDLWRKLDIQLNIDQESDVWRFPVETISQSEEGFEKVYQSSVLFPNWKITLNKKWRVSITQNFSVIKD